MGLALNLTLHPNLLEESADADTADGRGGLTADGVGSGDATGGGVGGGLTP